jgi:parvulin-like peptidyl-prolyl isomerase
MRTLCTAAGLAALIAACGLGQARAADVAIATVNGEAIPAAEFSKDWQAFADMQKKSLRPEQMTPQWEASRKQMLLEKIIEQRLLLQAAQKKKIAVKPQDLDEAVSRVKAKFKVDGQGKQVSPEAAEEAFKKQLAAENLTEKQFKENIANQLRGVALTDEIVKERVKQPSAEEVRKTFDSVKDRLVHPSTSTAAVDRRQAEIDAMARDLRLRSAERVQLQHILFRVDADATSEHRDAVLMQAKQVKAKLDKGADFADMARQYSDDATSGRNGGEAGFVARGELQDQSLDSVIFSLPVGGVSDVVKARPGYEIFRVEEKRAASDLRFEGVRKYLEDNLLRFAAQDEWARYVKELRRAATVDIKADFAKPDPAR